MSTMSSQITGVSIVCSMVCSGADQRKHQSSASLAFVRGIHRRPVDSPHKGPVTGKMYRFDDVITKCLIFKSVIYLVKAYINPSKDIDTGHVIRLDFIMCIDHYCGCKLNITYNPSIFSLSRNTSTYRNKSYDIYQDYSCCKYFFD